MLNLIDCERQEVYLSMFINKSAEEMPNAPKNSENAIDYLICGIVLRDDADSLNPEIQYS